MAKTPRSLHEDHQELLEFAMRLAREDGASAEPARRLLRLLEVHFQKEENFAAPPLGLLPRLARGDVSPGMAETLAHSDWLRRNLDVMYAEHQMIAAALEELLKVAGDAPEVITFAESLLNHSRLEEEVLYPAAILAGEYLKRRLSEHTVLSAA